MRSVILQMTAIENKFLPIASSIQKPIIPPVEAVSDICIIYTT